VITVWSEDKQEKLVLLTNSFKLAASTIAAIYKRQPQIEPLFKLLPAINAVPIWMRTALELVPDTGFNSQLRLAGGPLPAVSVQLPLSRLQSDGACCAGIDLAIGTLGNGRMTQAQSPGRVGSR
jgi:hypothetical protein